jgi:hypothetical protein
MIQDGIHLLEALSRQGQREEKHGSHRTLIELTTV